MANAADAQAAHRQPPEQWDVVVVGGGVAGLAAATLFAAEGVRVACVDARPPAPADPYAQQRSTALLTPAIATLERIGVWSAVRAHAAPLRAMRMIDDPGEAAGHERAAGQERAAEREDGAGQDGAGDAARARASEPLSVDFDAAEIDADAFGWNAPNGALIAALTAALEAQPTAELIAPARAASVIARDDAAFVTLEGGRRLRASLVVGADGRDSFVRKAMDIGARRVSYGQTALAFMVRCAEPHEGVSTEIHRQEGPFVLVPATDGAPTDGSGADGGPAVSRCSVVWVARASEARRLADLDPDAFSAAATERSLGVQGPLTLISPRELWPSASLLADRFVAKRVALMAEAAHAAPPIGAQGLNMSLADAASLVDAVVAARQAGRDIGGADLLAAYERARRPDAAARVAATAALNVAAIGAAAPIRAVRREALRAIGAAGPIRRALMRAGLGGGKAP